MSGSQTLTDFLLARITEDEAIARESRPDEYLSTRDASPLEVGARGDLYSCVIATSGRVLAECKAKRELVNMHWTNNTDDSGQHDCPGEWVNGCDDRGESCPTLRFLALPYADHPDYLSEWRPFA